MQLAINISCTAIFNPALISYVLMYFTLPSSSRTPKRMKLDGMRWFRNHSPHLLKWDNVFMIAPLCCVSLPFDPSSLRQTQMLDIQIRLRLFLFPLQQMGTSDRLTIRCYYFPPLFFFFSIDGTSYTTRKPCFDWGGYNHCHEALEACENTNRQILNKKCWKGCFWKATHVWNKPLLTGSSSICDAQSCYLSRLPVQQLFRKNKKNQGVGFSTPSLRHVMRMSTKWDILLINLPAMTQMCKCTFQTLTVPNWKRDTKYHYKKRQVCLKV